jgi:hypothetical protein
MGVERIGGQGVGAADQFESIGGHDQMQVAGLAANGAVAIRDLDSGGGRHFESDPTAMTTAAVYLRHPFGAGC